MRDGSPECQRVGGVDAEFSVRHLISGVIAGHQLIL